MAIELRLLLGAACAALLVYALTPVAIRTAGRLEFYDKPAGYKGHSSPTPYLGGAAVMAGFLLALLAVSLAVDVRQSLAIAGGVALLWAVGTIDDRRNLSPGLRVVVETGLATGLWALGVGWDLGLGSLFDLLCTIGWVLVVVNAFNLFDNMDGQSSTMALVVSAAVAVLGLIEGNVWLAATAGALAGSCLGFLPHNMSSPARIFLGDGGSMPLGFAVAAIVMIGTSDAVAAWQALLVGVMLIGVPALDTALVVVSRRRRGISVLTGGQDHLTHRTRRRFQTTRRVAAVLGGAQALVAALALFSAEGGSGIVLGGVLAYLAVAGATIAMLEAEEKRLEQAAVEAPAASTGRRRWLDESPALVALTILGTGAGLSPFWFGFYDSSLWAPLGLVLVVACAAALLARPLRTSRAGRVLLAGAAGLAVWTFLSSRWAESAQQAVLEGNRALIAVVVLALAMVLVRGRLRAQWLVGAVGLGILVVAGDTVVRLLLGDQGLFLNGRLNNPLGYINAEATTFLIGMWLALALAERRRPALAGVGLALATALAGLALLALSRGAAAALLGSALLVLVLVPGRVRRLAALGVVVAGVAVASRWLLDVSASGVTGSGATIRSAGVALLLVSVAAGALWGVAVAVVRSVEAAGRLASARRVAAGLVVVAGVAVVGVGLSQAGRIADEVSAQYRAFTALDASAAPSGTGRADRLVSGSGNRYDYWRVGVRAWEDAPVIGVGAGNYDVPWFRERTVTEDVRQPHSIEIQVLSETGIVGALLLLVLVGAALAAFVAAGRRARHDGGERLLAVACLGGATTWFVHTSVDWMHLMPGLTAVALCLVAVAARRPDAEATAPVVARAVPRPARAGLALATAAVLVLAGASLTRQALAERELGVARAELADDPGAALRAANRSLKLDATDVSAFYAKAAALARFDEGPAAEAVIRQAIEREPSDFVSWALLGDLRTRLGDDAGARRAYVRAARLNPRDVGLAGLARDAAPSSG